AYCGLSTTIAPGSGVESSSPRHAPKSVTRPLLRPPCLVPSPPTKRLTSETKNPGCDKPKMSRQGQLRISLPHPSPARGEGARSPFGQGCYCEFNGIGAKAVIEVLVRSVPAE